MRHQVVLRAARPTIVPSGGPSGASPGLPSGGAAGSRLRLARRYGWLLTDQAVFALTNLVLNVLFAHWLTPVAYGLFGVTFSGFILLSVLHWYVVVEPLLVESARITPDRVRPYVSTLIRAHLILLAATTVLAVLAWLAGTLLGRSELGLGIAAAVGCGCALLTLATARRLCLAFLTAAVSAQVGLLYLVAATATAWLLHRLGAITWFALWVVMSVWSLVCAAVICAILLSRTGPGRPYRMAELVRATTPFMRWGGVSAGFSWVRSDGIFAVLALSGGLANVAVTRAVVTLNAPVVQLNSALNAAFIVEFGRHGRGSGALRRGVLQRALLYAAAALPAVLAACVVDGRIMHLVFRGKFDAGAWLMPVFLLSYALNGIEGVLTSAMKAGGILRDAYLPHMVGSVGVGVTALALIPRAGVPGAAAAVLAGAVAGLATAVLLFSRECRRHV